MKSSCTWGVLCWRMLSPAGKLASFEQYWFHSADNAVQILSLPQINKFVIYVFLEQALFLNNFPAIFLACFHSPLLFLMTLSATDTTDKAKVWHIIKMLRGNFIWTHKPEHLLMKAGARINTLRQLGSLSKSLISQAVEQPFHVGAQRASAVPPGSTCFPELAITFNHAALMNTPKLRAGQMWVQDKLRYVSNCSHGLKLTCQRAVSPLRCPALFPLLRHQNNEN